MKTVHIQGTGEDLGVKSELTQALNLQISLLGGSLELRQSPDRPERQKSLSSLSLLKMGSFLRGKRSLTLHRLITTFYFSPVVVPPFLST